MQKTNPGAYLDIMRRVIGDFMEPFIPTVTMTAYYGNHRLINSSELILPVAQITPRVGIGGEHDELYTLVMIDPDTPSPNQPSSQEVVSWVVTNIPGGTSSAQGVEVIKNDVPNPKVGVHRFIMLLYKQQSSLNTIQALSSLVCFKSRDFAQRHNLGKLMGITYFYVRRQAKRNAPK